jgi:hypothetical protein
MQKFEKREIAHEIKETFALVSPFIEKHTSLVCPECEKVCCADKHGCYDSDDLFFLNSLGIEVSQDGPERNEEGSCRYITDKGCSLQRWMRPFRCTFFFCDRLLKSIEDDNAKLYRAFTGYFQYLVSLRQRLLGQETDNGGSCKSL